MTLIRRTMEKHCLKSAVRERGLKQFVGEKLETYPIRSADNPNQLLPDSNVDSNRLLRDRDGGLLIGTHESGMIHLHQRPDGHIHPIGWLSGNIVSQCFRGP